MVDELVYSELAKSFASSGELLVRDVETSGYGVLYPALVSPAYLLFDDVPDAYAAVKTVNALLMSTAAIPAYLIARRLLSTAWSLLAAVLAVSVPSLVYTATVMTENAFYPLFLVVAWALIRALEQPTLRSAAVLWLLVTVAFAVRPHAVVLAPAIVTAPALLVTFERSGLRGLRRYAPLYAGAVALVVLAAVVAIARGQTPGDLLGAYDVVTERNYELGSVLEYWLWHVAELTLYVLVVPVAALVVLLASARRRPRPVQAFLAASLSLVVWLSLAVAAFASEFADRILERNLFYVAPLLFIALLVPAAHTTARRWLRATAVTAAAALPLLLPYDRFLGDGDALALLALTSSPLDSAFWTVALGALAVGAAFVVAPPRWTLAIPLLLLVGYATIGYAVFFGARGMTRAAEQALAVGIGSENRDWIDRAVPEGTNVSAVWTGRLHPLTIHESEFFNRSVGRVYRTGAPTPGGLAETPATVTPDGTLSLSNGRPVAERYVLTDDGGTITPAGVAIARAPEAGLTLWQAASPLTTLTRVDGLHAGSTWSGATVAYTRERCDGGTLNVRLASDPSLFAAATTVVVESGGEQRRVRFAPDDQTTLRIPLSAVDGRCVVRFTVSPTVVPREVVAGSTDGRRLGAHFRAFLYEP